jgi:hypothetical protein
MGMSILLSNDANTALFESNDLYIVQASKL